MDLMSSRLLFPSRTPLGTVPPTGPKDTTKIWPSAMLWFASWTQRCASLCGVGPHFADRVRPGVAAVSADTGGGCSELWGAHPGSHGEVGTRAPAELAR